MTSVAETRHHVPNRFVVSPAWDMLYIVATPIAIIPIVWVVSRYWLTPEQLSLGVIAFASMGHHLPGFLRAYGDHDLFRRFRWRFLLMPPLAFATALFFAPPPSVAATFQWTAHHFSGLDLMLMFWGTWHGLMQIYGFMRIYDAKRGETSSRSARLDLLLCFCIFGAGVVFSDSRIFAMAQVAWQVGLPIVGPEWLTGLRIAAAVASAGVVALYAANLLAAMRAGRGASGLKILLAATTGVLYWFSGRLAVNVLVGIAMFEIFHAVQYNAIVWVYNRHARQRSGRRFGPLGFLFRRRWSMLALYIGAIAAYGAIRFAAGDGSGLLASDLQDPDAGRLLMALFATSTLLHYYYDGFIWKVREKSTQRNLNIDTPASRGEIVIPGVVHAGKWAVFYAIAAGLLVTEWNALPADARQRAARDREILSALARWTERIPEVQPLVVQQWIEQGEEEKAIAAARQVVALRPRSHQSYSLLGNTYLDLKRYDEAADALRHATALAPQIGDYWYSLAIAFRQSNRRSEAADAVRRAVDVQPDRLRFRLELVTLLIARREYGDALREAEATVARWPDDAKAYNALGDAQMAAGRYSDATVSLRRAVALGADSPRVYAQLGDVLARSGQPAAAQAEYRRALSVNARYVRARIELAQLLMADGKTGQAIDQWKVCVDQAPGSDVVYAGMGAALHEQQDFAQAQVCYGEALRLAPGSAKHRYNLGIVLLLQGRTEEARALILEAQRMGIVPRPTILRALQPDAVPAHAPDTEPAGQPSPQAIKPPDNPIAVCLQWGNPCRPN